MTRSCRHPEASVVSVVTFGRSESSVGCTHVQRYVSLDTRQQACSRTINTVDEVAFSAGTCSYMRLYIYIMLDYIYILCTGVLVSP